MLTALTIAAPLVILGLLMYAAAVEEQRWVDTVEQPGVDDGLDDVGAAPSGDP